MRNTNMWQLCFQVVMLRWIAPFITESSITSELDPENTLYVIMLASAVLLQGGFHSFNIRHFEADMEAPSAVKGEIWKTLRSKLCSLSEVFLIFFFKWQGTSSQRKIGTDLCWLHKEQLQFKPSVLCNKLIWKFECICFCWEKSGIITAVSWAPCGETKPLQHSSLYLVQSMYY